MDIAIDFDNTISNTGRWKGKLTVGDPIVGAATNISMLHADGHNIIINTCRPDLMNVCAYLRLHGIPYSFVNNNPKGSSQNLGTEKVLADVYIDDKGLQFMGVWDQAFYEKVVNFKPWYKR